MAAAIGASFIHSVFEKIGNAEGYSRGLPELESALAVFVDQGEAGGGAGQNVLQDVAGGFDSILGESARQRASDSKEDRQPKERASVKRGQSIFCSARGHLRVRSNQG